MSSPLDNMNKLQLEKYKLELEIKQLNQKWWRKPSYIGIILPSLIAIGTLFIGYKTGYFQTISEKLSIKELKLEEDIEDLAEKKKSYELQIINLADSLNNLQSIYEVEIDKRSNLALLHKEVLTGYDVLKEENRVIKKTKRHLEKRYAKLKYKYQELKLENEPDVVNTNSWYPDLDELFARHNEKGKLGSEKRRALKKKKREKKRRRIKDYMAKVNKSNEEENIATN